MFLPKKKIVQYEPSLMVFFPDMKLDIQIFIE
jgi:hypothetical protein